MSVPWVSARLLFAFPDYTLVGTSKQKVTQRIFLVQKIGWMLLFAARWSLFLYKLYALLPKGNALLHLKGLSHSGRFETPWWCYPTIMESLNFSFRPPSCKFLQSSSPLLTAGTVSIRLPDKAHPRLVFCGVIFPHLVTSTNRML